MRKSRAARVAQVARTVNGVYASLRSAAAELLLETHRRKRLGAGHTGLPPVAGFIRQLAVITAAETVSARGTSVRSGTTTRAALGAMSRQSCIWRRSSS